jgi:hypothetical protein
MPKVVNKSEFVSEALRLDREGVAVATQAKVFGLNKDAFVRRMSRYGYRRHTPQSYWSPKQAAR